MCMNAAKTKKKDVETCVCLNIFDSSSVRNFGIKRLTWYGHIQLPPRIMELDKLNQLELKVEEVESDQ